MLFGLLLQAVPAAAHLVLAHSAQYGRPDHNSPHPATPQLHETFDSWWFKGHVNYPPPSWATMNLPSGGVFSAALTCSNGLPTPSYSGFPCGNNISDAGTTHTKDKMQTPLDQLRDVRGCGIAIAYESDATKIQPEDFAVITVNYSCPFVQQADFQIPSNLPPCPAGGCTCMWGWIHSPNAGGQPEMYTMGYRCNVTGATGTAPLPPPKIARKCPIDRNNCTVGPKQMHYWVQKERNNNFQSTNDPPFYNGDYGFTNGAQTDLFDLGDESLYADNCDWAPGPQLYNGPWSNLASGRPQWDGVPVQPLSRLYPTPPANCTSTKTATSSVISSTAVSSTVLSSSTSLSSSAAASSVASSIAISSVSSSVASSSVVSLSTTSSAAVSSWAVSQIASSAGVSSATLSSTLAEASASSSLMGSTSEAAPVSTAVSSTAQSSAVLNSSAAAPSAESSTGVSSSATFASSAAASSAFVGVSSAPPPASTSVAPAPSSSDTTSTAASASASGDVSADGSAAFSATISATASSEVSADVSVVSSAATSATAAPSDLSVAVSGVSSATSADMASSSVVTFVEASSTVASDGALVTSAGSAEASVSDASTPTSSAQWSHSPISDAASFSSAVNAESASTTADATSSLVVSGVPEPAESAPPTSTPPADQGNAGPNHDSSSENDPKASHSHGQNNGHQGSYSHSGSKKCKSNRHHRRSRAF